MYRFTTALLDAAGLLVWFVLVGLWRFEDLRISNPEYYNYYLQLWILAGVSWFAVGSWAGVYRYRSGLEQRNVTAQVLQAALAQFAVLAVLVVGLKGYYYSRIFLATFFSVFYLWAWITRLLLVMYLRGQLAQGRWQRRFLLLGEHPTALELLHLLEARPELGWRCVERSNAHEPNVQAGQGFEEIVCAFPPSTSAYENWRLWAEKHGKRFRYIPDMGAHYAGGMSMETLEGIPVFAEREEPLTLWTNALLKRSFDLIVALFATLILLSWFLPFAALVIALGGGGSPFFIQERVGYGGTPFRVYKLRTLHPQTQKANFFQRQLRQLGLDELPQLLNVLAGQMSLVGPRPHTPGDDQNYGALVRAYRIRHWAKPGMTGLAQSRGLRGGGEAAAHALLEERIRADVYYIENWSVLLDIRILLETVLRTLFYPSSLHYNEKNAE